MNVHFSLNGFITIYKSRNIWLKNSKENPAGVRNLNAIENEINTEITRNIMIKWWQKFFIYFQFKQNKQTGIIPVR